MWKNKEIKIGTIFTILLVVVQFFLLKECELQQWKKLTAMAIPLIIYSYFIGSSYYRYRKISDFTEYLNRIQNGEYTIPLQENQEGELSILQNEVYKVTKRLMEQAELLQEQKTFLSDSLSNISHQLKTPVTSMLMMAELLEQPNLPEEKRLEFTNNMILGLERMQWLVQGLLLLAKLDSDTIQMKRDMVRVEELMIHVKRQLQVMADEKNISIVLEGSSDVTFTGDYGWSVEAFSNIVKNCIEHTGEHGIIHISYGFNSLSTYITVKDNGVGITETDLYHIFERFYKGKNASSNSVGIGLALAKEIVGRQKGTISVTSEVGTGTEFQIKFYEQ